MAFQGTKSYFLALCLTLDVFLLSLALKYDCTGKPNRFYPDPDDCRLFYRCFYGQVSAFGCPKKTAFSVELNVCDWEKNVDCKDGHRSSTSFSSNPTTLTTTTKAPTTPSPPTTTTTTPPPPTTTKAITTSSPSTKTETTTTTTTTSIIKVGSPTKFGSLLAEASCAGRPAGDMFRNPQDCSSYYWCVNGKPLLLYCSSGLMFNDDLDYCDWSFNVNCSTTPKTTSTTTTIPAVSTATTSTAIAVNITTTAPTNAVTNSTPASAGCPRKVCYYTNWSQYRPGQGKFVPENIEASLCTHLIYAFAQLEGNNVATFEWNDDVMYTRFNNLKQTNPSVKTLLAVGGWNMGTYSFTQMVASADSRRQFAEQSVVFLKRYGFDGLDLDWEYPANRGSPPEDKERFTLLVKQLRETFDTEALQNRGTPLLLTAAVAAGKSTIDTGYEVAVIAKYLDFINLMTYDLHGSWEGKTGHHAALYAHPNEIGELRYLNVDWTARYWVEKGCPKEKLVIGIPTYARTFTLSSSITSLGAPTSGAGSAGIYTLDSGFLAYYEVCELQKAADAQQRWIDPQKVPYLVTGNQWVGYENLESVREKVRYAKANGYGGVMAWSLSLDDFTGAFCGQGAYPLWSAVNQECQA